MYCSSLHIHRELPRTKCEQLTLGSWYLEIEWKDHETNIFFDDERTLINFKNSLLSAIERRKKLV